MIIKTPVVILTRNCLELTKKCVASVKAQDLPTEIRIFDNGSTDGTVEWAIENAANVYISRENQGVSRGWNISLYSAFRLSKASHVLVVNNDTILPPTFLSSLMEADLPFVTGASVDTMEAIENCGPFSQAYPGPDFSAFLIRWDAFEKIGMFDESMVNYCSDCSYHVRAHRKGIELMNSGIPFYHERSSTLKHASDEDRNDIQMRADLDRDAFKVKYGCYPWEPAYAELFTPNKTESLPT